MQYVIVIVGTHSQEISWGRAGAWTVCCVGKIEWTHSIVVLRINELAHTDDVSSRSAQGCCLGLTETPRSSRSLIPARSFSGEHAIDQIVSFPDKDPCRQERTWEGL